MTKRVLTFCRFLFSCLFACLFVCWLAVAAVVVVVVVRSRSSYNKLRDKAHLHIAINFRNQYSKEPEFRRSNSDYKIKLNRQDLHYPHMYIRSRSSRF